MTARLSGKLRTWVGGAMSEAAARMVILTGTTAVLARLLEPGDFGAAALVLTVVAIFSVCVGMPFEEALAQRRVLRSVDLKAALAASLAAAAVFIAAAAPIGALMAWGFARHDLALLLPVAATQLLAQAFLSVSTAVARRRRAFTMINVASLCGHLVGAAVALILALDGAGIGALIGLRIGIVAANALALAVLLGLWLRPRWSWPHIAALSRFAGVILFTRLMENTTYLIYNFIVGQLFGLTVLGYVNMALRIVEPLRGAIAAITHNLCFAFFATVARDPARAAEGAVAISAQSALLTAPMFMGVAGISPILIPLMAGPGWDQAVPIAAMLAVGGMVLLPSQIALTALSAIGRPTESLWANAVGLLTVAVVLVATAGMDPSVVGAARLLGDVAQAGAAIGLSVRVIPLPRRALLERLAVAWIAAALMAVGVAALGRTLAGTAPLMLAVGVVAGVLIYAAILAVLDRASLLALLRIVTARSSVAVRERAA